MSSVPRNRKYVKGQSSVDHSIFYAVIYGDPLAKTVDLNRQHNVNKTQQTFRQRKGLLKNPTKCIALTQNYLLWFNTPTISTYLTERVRSHGLDLLWISRNGSAE